LEETKVSGILGGMFLLRAFRDDLGKPMLIFAVVATDAATNL
jgi:hypothetical protein